MKQIEKEDDLWEESQRKKEKHRAVRNIIPAKAGPESETDTTTRQSASNEAMEPEKPKMKSNAPRGFY